MNRLTKTFNSEPHFVSYSYAVADLLAAAEKHATADHYRVAASSFMRFCKGHDIPIREVDGSLIADYEAYLAHSGVSWNTISFYMRNLRTIFNRAVKEHLVEPASPFQYVYTGVAKTVKRGTTMKVIRALRRLDLSKRPALDFARDIFLFSFYARGMSFVDMAFLKKCDLRKGVLSYTRSKTKQRLTVQWHAVMQAIVDKYDTSATPYLLPIIKEEGNKEYNQYIRERHRVNRCLKKLGVLLNLPQPLTTYVARHSWATIANGEHIPVSVISEALGHQSERVTRIYIASLNNNTEVDDANSMIIKKL